MATGRGNPAHLLQREGQSVTDQTTPAQLKCTIISRDYSGREPNFLYNVFDEDGTIVARGVSSSEAWVRNDAGGYHTKKKFDEMFPQGWNVEFDF